MSDHHSFARVTPLFPKVKTAKIFIQEKGEEDSKNELSPQTPADMTFTSISEISPLAARRQQGEITVEDMSTDVSSDEEVKYLTLAIEKAINKRKKLQKRIKVLPLDESPPPFIVPSKTKKTVSFLRQKIEVIQSSSNDFY